MNDAPPEVGGNVRRLRQGRNLSLSALARRSGIAKATLSALESGNANPTVSTLHALATALRVPLGELVSNRQPATAHVLRADAAGLSATDDRLVGSFHRGGLIEVYDVRLQAGSEFVYPAHADGTFERVLVTEGSLLVGPNGDAVDVSAGDFVAFPSDREHVFATEEGARAALVVAYPVTVPPESPIHGQSRENG